MCIVECICRSILNVDILFNWEMLTCALGA